MECIYRLSINTRTYGHEYYHVEYYKSHEVAREELTLNANFHRDSFAQFNTHDEKQGTVETLLPDFFEIKAPATAKWELARVIIEEIPLLEQAPHSQK